ncbi:MAG: Abortive infection protein [Nocardioides sp.]|nr:Abortive infection protein [Nocardioides sp.]
MPEVAGLAYERIHRAGRPGWWRPVTGVLTLIVAEILVVPVVLLIPFTIGFLVHGGDLQKQVETMLDTTNPTPAGLAYLNLALAAAILVAWLLTRVLHGLRPRWLASVRPRIRWTWFAACFGVAVVALIATVVVSAVLPAQGDAGDMGGQLNDFTATTRDFALVVLLLTPLQAAGEEYAFRGYLTQAFGGLFRQRWVAVVAPALLFALAHGAQDAPIFFDRFAFGIVAGILAITTGGLEAGIAMHVLNNWLAFGLALAYGDMASTLNPSGGTWWSIPVTLTQSLVYLGLVLLVARRMGLRTTADPAVLEGSRGRV